MATMNPAEVGIGSAKVTGAIWIGAANATLPTDATTALDTSAFTLLGFTSEDGVTISESSSTDSIRAWEGRKKVHKFKTEYTENVSFTPIQCNSDVAKLLWGDGHVTIGTNGALTIEHHGEEIDPVAIVIETSPRAGMVKRYVGIFQLTERGEQTMDGQSVDGRQATFEAVEDENGVTMTEHVAYIED